MTLMERSPNLIFANRLVGKIFARQDTHDKDCVEEIDASDIVNDVEDETAEPAADPLKDHFGDQASAFRLMTLISAADAEDARIIGIVGSERGVGASLTSRQLAGAYASFGRKVLLVDASALPEVSDAQTCEPAAELFELAGEVRPSLSVVDLPGVIGDASLDPKEFSSALKSAARAGRTIIVDLPPIVDEDGRPNTAIRDFGAGCDLIFLVCLTGQMRRKELSECVETCRVVGVELSGIILNDWKLPASQLLES